MESPFYGGENFEPKFFTGGPTRCYLPLFFDIVVQEKPALIVALGLADAQAHLTFCQAVVEQDLSSQCVAVRRTRADEPANDDPAWQLAQEATARLFASASQLVEADVARAGADFADGSVDVLLIDDIDCGETVRQELEIWRPKLSANALVLLHGIGLERQDSPGNAWANFIREKAEAHFAEGIGLGVATEVTAAKGSPFRTALFDQTTVLAQGYRLIAESIIETKRARHAERRARFFETRQTLFETIVEDRTKAQSVIEYQERWIADFNRRFEEINADRAKAQELLAEPVGTIAELAQRFSIVSRDRADAQLVMDDQFAQIQKMHAKLTEQKQALTVAKSACRNKGRCFVVPKGLKPRRSVGERVAREFARIPRKLRRIFLPQQVPPKEKIALSPIEKDYAKWIAQHEPT